MSRLQPHPHNPPEIPETEECLPQPLTWRVVLPALSLLLLAAGIFAYLLWQLCVSTQQTPNPHFALSPLS